MSCQNKSFYDNGYLFGYYCDISGEICDFLEFESLCAAYEECDEDDKY